MSSQPQQDRNPYRDAADYTSSDEFIEAVGRAAATIAEIMESRGISESDAFNIKLSFAAAAEAIGGVIQDEMGQDLSVAIFSLANGAAQAAYNYGDNALDLHTDTCKELYDEIFESMQACHDCFDCDEEDFVSFLNALGNFPVQEDNS